jgi:hypothetical protein
MSSIMSEKNLENFLKNLNKEEDEERLVILQRITEKILNYLLTTIETTETRINDLENGMNNISQLLNQQLQELIARLKLAPGLEAINDIQLPKVVIPRSEGGLGQQFLETIALYIDEKAEQFAAKQPVEKEPECPEKEEVPVVLRPEPVEESRQAKAFDQVAKKEKELSEKEAYLTKLADQLAAKEQNLQERENNIDMIESTIEDRARLAGSLDSGENKKAGPGSKKEERDDLAELSKLSESIIEAEGMDDGSEENSPEMLGEEEQAFVEKDNDQDDDTV